MESLNQENSWLELAANWWPLESPNVFNVITLGMLSGPCLVYLGQSLVTPVISLKLYRPLY